MSEKFMIIDGNSIMNRAFYGLQGSNMLSTSEGLYTNAIYGFLNILFKYKEEEKPDYICIAFDLKSPTFRHKEFDGYKATRKGMPDELRMQVPVLKEVIDALNIRRVELEGFEADDMLGTFSNFCEKNGIDTVIVTGDKDSFQLISPATKVKIPLTRGGKTETLEYTLEKFRESYGIEPEQFIDVKGIMGDTSDNIPGIDGVGEKTALKLIQEYKNIENVLDSAEKLNVRANVKESIKNGREIALLSKRLATIERNVPIEIHIKDYAVCEENKEKLYELFKRLEFNSFIQKFNLKAQSKTNIEVEIVNKNEAKGILELVSKNKRMVYHPFYDNTQDEILQGLGIFIDNKAYYLSYEGLLETLKPFFENSSILKFGYNIKQDMVTLKKKNIDFNGIGSDIMVAAYLLNPSRENYSLESIYQEYLGSTLPSYKETFGQAGAKEDISKAACYFGMIAEGIEKISLLMEEKIKEFQQERLYYEVELPLVEVLASMETEGFLVDKEQLQSISKELSQKIILLEEEIYEGAGEKFNINSPKQLGVILFDKLKLPIVKKTKTGYSTDAEVLETLKPYHIVVEKILEYRQLIKLKTTYADGLTNVINPITGKIHSSFNQTVTQTGRISSTEPNLQNIPVRLEMGKLIRKVFTASSKEHILVDADYSQIELRVLAHIADDQNMIDAFLHNEDIHRKTASEVFGVPLNEVSSLMRSRAKAVNFGIVYGIGDFSLSKDLGITRKEAKAYIEGYLNKFTGVRKYMEETVEMAKIKGYVTTLLNRRRYLPELKSSNFNIRSFGERVAMNTPIQGTAADIIKIAMVNVYNELKKNGLKSKLILQVHDELIIDAKKDELDKVKEILSEEMTKAIQLKVPLAIDMNVGSSWYDTK